MPMGALYRLAGFAIPLVKLFCCQRGFHFNSFGHTSSIHYTNGFDIIAPWEETDLKKRSSLLAF
jgi:hypothetical protein